MTDASTTNVVVGASQSVLRNHNERLILSMIRASAPVPASDLARQVSLSAQTVSVIVRDLEREGLLTRGDPMRGKVGKPSIPMTLNPDGGLGIGIKIGRRSVDVALMDLRGEVRVQRRSTYRYPMPGPIFDFLDAAFTEILGGLPDTAVRRVCGVGLAAPFEIWNWHEVIGAPSEAFDAWLGVDFRKEIGRFTTLPLVQMNDATAACRAEHYLSGRQPFRDYIYFFMGALIGGGIVLNGSVYDGAQGNAGALGPMVTTSRDGQTGQLLDLASTHLLEREIAAGGDDPADLWDLPQDWSRFEPQVASWIEQCGHAIAQAALSACAVVDFEGVVIDGAFPDSVRSRLTGAVRAAMESLDKRGIVQPLVVEGMAGGDARVRGAAYAPISSQFFLDSARI